MSELGKWNQKKLFKAIEPAVKIDFNKYFNEIDFISNLMNEANEYHSIILKRSEVLRNKISESDNLYMTQLLNFIRRERLTAGENSVHYIFALEKLQYYNKEIAGKRNLTKYYKNIIKPMQSQLALHENSHVDFVHELLVTGKFLINNYCDLRQLIVEVRLEYRKFSFLINKSLNTLKSLNN